MDINSKYRGDRPLG